MIVTTSLRPTEHMITAAKKVAKDLEIPFIKRNKEAIYVLQEQCNCNVFVTEASRLTIFQQGVELPLFFHPNSAMFRVKRILKGEADPFVEAAKLTKEMSLLDCTLGLASDSIVSSVVVGKKGKVVGVEGNRYLAYLVSNGLKSWDSGLSEMNRAMKAVEVVAMENLTFLRNLETASFDVVYFDPMFETKIDADGINGIRGLALYSPLDEETLEEAKRVAKFRVVLKDHWQSQRFQRFRFHVLKRQSAQFHYATIEL